MITNSRAFVEDIVSKFPIKFNIGNIELIHNSMYNFIFITNIKTVFRYYKYFWNYLTFNIDIIVLLERIKRELEETLNGINQTRMD